jgi:hypothetical protein
MLWLGDVDDESWIKICQVEEINRGSFNVNFTVKFLDDGEKLRFIKANTQIPVPSVIAWGDYGFLLGPYMITNFIEGTLLNARYHLDSGLLQNC